MNDDYDRRRFLEVLGTAGTVAATSLAGCSGDGDAATTPNGDAGPVTVEMTDDLAFDPAAVTVSAGTTVVWENVGGIGHSVTAYESRIPDGADYFASGEFDDETTARDRYAEGAVQGGERYEHTFDVVGTYGYFCIPHEQAGMKGTVEVTE